VEIIALDDEVAPRCLLLAQFRDRGRSDEILVDRLVGLDLVALPDEPQLLRAVPLLQKLDQLFARKAVVSVAHSSTWWVGCSVDGRMLRRTHPIRQRPCPLDASRRSAVLTLTRCSSE